jgi:hypothetical protein
MSSKRKLEEEDTKVEPAAKRHKPQQPTLAFRLLPGKITSIDIKIHILTFLDIRTSGLARPGWCPRNSDLDRRWRLASKIVTEKDGHVGGFTRTTVGGRLHSLDDMPSMSNSEEKRWYRDGLCHRDGDKPAIIYECVRFGYNAWCQNGQYHRDGDKPAVVDNKGNQSWYRNGLRHRDGDKPAVVDADGSMMWWQHDQRHRDGDGPAAVYANRVHLWYRYDKLHRANGKPAVLYNAYNGECWEEGVHKGPWKYTPDGA